MNNWSTYRPISPVLRDLGLSCLGAGEQGGKLPSFKSRRLSSYGLVYVSHGSGWFQLGGSREKVTAPALIWLYPGLEHGYGPDAQGWTEHWALFSGVGVRAFEELGCFDRNHPLVHLAAADPDLAALFGLLREGLRTEGPLGDCRPPSTPSSSLPALGAAALPAPLRARLKNSWPALEKSPTSR